MPLPIDLVMLMGYLLQVLMESPEVLGYFDVGARGAAAIALAALAIEVHYIKTDLTDRLGRVEECLMGTHGLRPSAKSKHHAAGK